MPTDELTITDPSNKRRRAAGMFLTPELLQRIDLIRHLLANTARVPYVLAPKGAGKSEMARHLPVVLKESYQVSLILCHGSFSVEGLRVLIAQDVGLSPGEATDSQLAKRLAALHDQSRPLLVILDDVDQLQPEPLAWLLQLLAPRQAGLSAAGAMVLLSEVDVLALPLSPVDLAGLQDRVQVLDMPSFNHEQTAAFLDYCLDLMRPRERERVTLPDARGMVRMHRETGGLPGAILRWIDYQPPLMDGNESVTAGRRRWPWVVAGVAIALPLVGALYYQDAINRFLAGQLQPQAAEPELQTLRLPPLPSVTAVDKPPLTSLTPPASPEATVAPELASAAPPPPAEKPVVEAALPQTTTLEIPVPSAEPILQPTPAEAVGDPLAEKQVLDKPVVKAPQVEQVAPSLTESDAPEPKPQATVEAPAELPAASVKEPVAVTVTKSGAGRGVKSPTVSGGTASGLHNADWLLARPAGHYTLQLMASRDRASIDTFIARHRLKGDLAVITSQVRGQAWHALLWGDFPSRPAALRGVKKLPASLRNSKPWARSLGSVHKVLKASN